MFELELELELARNHINVRARARACSITYKCSSNEEFYEKGGYTVLENTTKPFKEITEEFKAIKNEDGIFGADHDLEEEEVIFINDFVGEEEEEEEDLDCALIENL